MVTSSGAFESSTSDSWNRMRRLKTFRRDVILDSEDLTSFCLEISGVSRNSKMSPVNSTNGDAPFRNQPNVSNSHNRKGHLRRLHRHTSVRIG